MFSVLNVIAAIHAYKFTHFSANGVRNENIDLSVATKLKLLLIGVDNPRPVNAQLPQGQFSTVKLQGHVLTEAWLLPALNDSNKGTVILFHGYTGNKSDLLPRALPLQQAGYNCLVVDFMGSGGSGGNTTTVGYQEAQQVKACYDYVRQQEEKKIMLLGSSMGAVAIMKAITDYDLKPSAVILECPFATMYETVCIRFKMLGVPTFPMAGLLVLWGGIENGFWGFSHNPVTYAKSIKCPILLQYGALDDRVARNETDRIFLNLAGQKKQVIYNNAGHDNYLETSPTAWKYQVTSFLNNH